MAQAPTEENEVKTNSKEESPSSQEVQTQRYGDGSNRQFQQRRPTRRQTDRQSSGSFQQPRTGYRRQFRSRRKVCAFCVDKEKVINWKNVDVLRRIIADNGKIHPRRKTGTCAKHQRQLAIAVKRARHLALLPFTTEHIRIMSKS